ncbi:hypothetical protein POTOM_055259 [Populus tomentosa]|uniref:Serine aminopeptidase S33 domain-containing protein n=1 Tax=Populus tomentosa TaxID=118781 RepID=A0A8X7Y4T5_POPTO|nr:hypothetical protein POTOM_055259 [Populus tomentosa]
MSLPPVKLSSGRSFFERCDWFQGKGWRRQRREKAAAAMASRPVRFPEIDDELRKIIDANMDEVPARKRAREAFKDIQLGIDHILFKTPCDGLKMEERHLKAGKLKIFKLSMLRNLNGIVCVVKEEGRWLVIEEMGSLGAASLRNYMDLERIARKLASSGYGFFAMDYPGYGLSEGLHGYIPCFDRLVDDVIEHYSKVKEKPEFRTLPSFLFGESLGGAVALKVHLKQPNAWNGAILVAPMCKIADDMTPPWLVTQMLIGVANFLPKHKLVPQKDLAEAAFRDPKNRKLAAYNVIAYKDKPRLKTAVEMLRTTQEIERRLEEVSLPLLILHGEADTVTDPSVSKALHEKACCSDKKLKIYKDAYHALLEGEPDEMIIQVFNDVISWLDERSRETSSC